MLNKEQLKSCYLDIEMAVESIKSAPNQSSLIELQNSLNKFFPNSNCVKVIYTSNMDKMFFGVYVMPRFEVGKIVEYLLKSDRIMINNYYLELDSKLFDDFLGLSIKEITALILHDVYNLIADSSPFELFRKLLNDYLDSNKIILKFNDSHHYSELLSYGVRDTLRKLTSIFEINSFNSNNDLLNQLVFSNNFNSIINSAINKLSSVGYMLNKLQSNKLVTLEWILRIYSDISNNKVPAIKTIQRCQELTPSTIERMELINIGKNINRIDDDSLLESNIIKSMEDLRYDFTNGEICNSIIYEQQKMDYVDFLMSMDKDDDNSLVSNLIATVTNKMTMIQDYVSTHELSKEELKQWNTMFQNYSKQRTILSTRLDLFTPQNKLYSYYKNSDEN